MVRVQLSSLVLVAAALGGCWSGRRVRTEHVNTVVKRTSSDDIVERAVESRRDSRSGVVFTNVEKHKIVVTERVKREEWLVKPGGEPGGRRSKLDDTSYSNRARDPEYRWNDVSPYTGDLIVECKDDTYDWESIGTLKVRDGRITDLSELCYVPLSGGFGSVNTRLVGASSVRGLSGSDVYRALRERAMSTVGTSSNTRFGRNYRAWTTPVRKRIDLVSVALPSLKTDTWPADYPEPFVQVVADGRSLGCSETVGQDLGRGTYRFDSDDWLRAEFSPTGSVIFRLNDEDLSDHDQIKSWTVQGIPRSGEVGWLTIKVQDSDNSLESLGSCSNKGIDAETALALGVIAVGGGIALAAAADQDTFDAVWLCTKRTVAGQFGAAIGVTVGGTDEYALAGEIAGELLEDGYEEGSSAVLRLPASAMEKIALHAIVSAEPSLATVVGVGSFAACVASEMR